MLGHFLLRGILRIQFRFNKSCLKGRAKLKLVLFVYVLIRKYQEMSSSMRTHLADSGYTILPICQDNPDKYDLSIPLILPNDHEYDLTTKSIVKKDNVQRTSLYVVPAALELLSSVNTPLAVIAICGPMRTGKSYILSRWATIRFFVIYSREIQIEFKVPTYWMIHKVL